VSDSIFDAPNPDAPEQQPAFVLQRPPGQRSNLAHLLWATLVAVLLFFALCAAVAGGALLGGVGGALLALAVSLAYIAHLIDSA
jgi:hypothetical protein